MDDEETPLRYGVEVDMAPEMLRIVKGSVGGEDEDEMHRGLIKDKTRSVATSKLGR